MARKRRRRRRTGGNNSEEVIREEIESTVEDAIDDAVGELNIKTNKQRAKEIKEQLEKNLSAYDAMLRDQLITSTKKMFSRLSSDTSKAFGDLKGAEVSEDIRKHVSGIVKMIENSFLYDLGESKDTIADSVSNKNAEFMNQIIENLSKDMAEGKIYHGPQTEKEKGEMGLVLDDTFASLNDMYNELNELEDADAKLVNFVEDLMHTMSSGLPEDKIFMQVNKALKNQDMMDAAPEIKNMLDNIITNYKSFSNENFEDEVRQMQEFHNEQNRVSDILAFNMDMFVDGIRGAIAGFANFARDIKESEKQLYAIAAISDMSAPQIDSFRTEMMNLAVETPFAANVMTEAYGELVRTGKTAEESMIILKGVTDLAVASFEPLEKVASAVNSLMLAMEMSADTAGRVSSSLFSVLNATPLGFESLNNALTQTGAAFNAVIGQTSKTGEELENYKMSMTDLQASMIGGMSLLGKTGSQAGTAIRNMTTRLSSMETAAKTSLQSDLDKMGGFSYEGAYIRTHEDLTALAQEDFGKVTEVLSQMVKQGAISFDTLRKMFTGRNVTQIVGVLSQIDGNLDSFVKSMTGDADALEKATEIASRSWVQQYDQFTQTMSDFKTYLGGAMDVVAPVLFGINYITSAMAKLAAQSPLFAAAVNGAGVALMALAAKAIVVQTKLAASSMLMASGIEPLKNIGQALSNVKSVGQAFSLLGAKFKTFVSAISPLSAGILLLVAGLSAMYTLHKKGKAAQDNLNKAIEGNIKADINRQKALERSTKTLSDISKEFDSLKSFSLGDDVTKNMNSFMVGMNDSATAVSSLTQALSTFIDVVTTSEETLASYSKTGDLKTDINKYYERKISKESDPSKKKELEASRDKALKGADVALKRVEDFYKQSEAMGLSFSNMDASLSESAELMNLASRAVNLDTGKIDKEVFKDLLEKDKQFAESFRAKFETYAADIQKAKDALQTSLKTGYSATMDEKQAVSSLSKDWRMLLPEKSLNIFESIFAGFSGESDEMKAFIDDAGKIKKEKGESQKAIMESQTILISNALSVMKGNTDALTKEITDVVKPYEAKDSKELKSKIEQIKNTAETADYGKAMEKYYKEYIALYKEEDATGEGFEKFILQKGRAFSNMKAVDTKLVAELIKTGDNQGLDKLMDAKDAAVQLYSGGLTKSIDEEIDKQKDLLLKLETPDGSDDDGKIFEAKEKLSQLKEQKEKLLKEMSLTKHIDDQIKKDKKELQKLKQIPESSLKDDEKKRMQELEKAILKSRNDRFTLISGEMLKDKDSMINFVGQYSNYLATNLSDTFGQIADMTQGIMSGKKTNIEKLPEMQKKLEGAIEEAEKAGNTSLVGILTMILNGIVKLPEIVNKTAKGGDKAKIDMGLISTRLRELNNEINKTILDMLPDSTKKFSQISAVEDSDLLLSTFQDMQSFIKGKVDDADLGLDKGEFERTISKISESLSFDTLISQYQSMLTDSSLQLTESEKKEIVDKMEELKNRSNKAISDYNTNYFQKAISSLEGMMSSSEVYTPEMGAVIESYRQLQFELIDAMRISDNEKVRLKEAFEENVSKMRKENISRMVFDQNKEMIMEKLDTGKPQAARGIMDQMDEA